MSFLKFLLFILININIFCNTQQTKEYFLTSTAAYKISQQQLCLGGSVEKVLTTFQGEDTFITFSPKCGIQTIQLNEDGFKVIKTFDIKQKIKTSSIEKKKNLLWIADVNNEIYYYQFGGKISEFKFLGQLKKEASDSGTKDFVFSEDGQIMFIVNAKEIVVYNIATQINPILVQKIKSNSIVYLPLYIPEKQTLVIGNDGGDFYKTEYEPNLNPASFVDIQSVCHHNFIILPTKMQLLAGKYIIFTSEVYGIGTVDITSYFNSRVCTNFKINYLTGVNQIVGYKYVLLTKDQNYLITLSQYKNIEVYEIQYEIKQDVESVKFILFEQIKVSEASYDMSFFQGFDSILYFDYDQLYLFKKIESNVNKVGPNILNTSQNVVFNSYDDSQDCRRCRIHQELIYEAKLDAFYIFQKNTYNNYLKKVGKWKSPQGLAIEALAILQNSKQAIVGSSKLYFLDISDLNNIKQIASTDAGDPKIDADDIILSKDEKTLFVAGGYGGMYIIDIKNFSSPIFITKIYGIDIELGSSENIDIDSKSEFVYTVYRQKGIAVYDVRDLKQPKLASFYPSMWSESLDITQDDKYLILGERQRGVIIVDITNPYQLKEISRISLKKETFRVRLIWKDQYVVATNVRSYGQIMLIDIRDKLNPKSIQQYQYKRTEGACDFCTSSDSQIGFLPLFNEFVVMNLKPKQQYNMDLQLIKRGSQLVEQYYLSDKPLQVGMIVNMMVTRLYPQKYLQITDVFFYENFQNFQLPSWAVFNTIGQFVTLDITKESFISQREASLLSSTQNIKGQKTFLFKISEIIEESDFILIDLGIDKTLSKQIYIQCLIENLIDTEQNVKEYSEDLITNIFQNKYSSDIVKQIVSILKNKVTLLPFHLDIESSLYVNLDQSRRDIVESISDFVQVQVSIPNSDAKFKHSSYASVLIYYSEDYFTIKLEGDIKSINFVLNSGINIANFQDPQLIQLDIVVDDKLNYPVKSTFMASHPFLVNLNEPVILNPEITLQDDFSLKFEDSEVYILENFRYTFSQDVFIDKDDEVLTYSAKIFKNNEFEPIPKSFWINFSSSERTFEGRPDTSQYGDEYIIQVTATDGFTKNSQTLKISVKKIPITYLIQQISTILGAFLGVFGFIKKRNDIYNFVYKQKYVVSPITICAGQQVSYQIPLLEDSLTQGKLIWKSYLNKINIETILKEIRTIQQKCDFYQKLDKSSPVSPDQKLSFLQSSQQAHQTQCNDYTEEDKILMTDSSQINTRKMSFKQRDSLVKRTQTQIMKKSFLQKKYSQSKSMAENSQKQNLIFFDEESFDINEIKIISEIKQFYMKLQKSSLKNINDLENINSKLSRSILSQAIEEIANKEQQCQLVISYLLKISKLQGYTQHDWYKPYVIIQTQFNEILNNPFPTIIVNKEKIHISISQINNADNNQLISQITLNLVYKYIFYSSLGMMKLTDTHFSKIRGECLELFPHQISCVKCYKKVFVKRLFVKQMKEIFAEKELSQNQKLPSWIQILDLSHGVILIKGNPQNKDCGTFIFKIFDTSDFIIKQFTIEIKHQDVNESQIKLDNIVQKEIDLEQIIPDEIQEKGVYVNQNSEVNSNSICFRIINQ